MLKIKAPERAARGAALTVAAGAVACGVRCVLPFALPAVALASAGGIYLHDGNCDRGVAPRAAVVPRRALDYPSFEAMTVIALWASHFVVHTG